MKQTWCILSIDATQQFSAEGWYSPGPMRNGISSLLPFVLLLVGCGGAEPPPRTPEAPPPAAKAHAHEVVSTGDRPDYVPIVDIEPNQGGLFDLMEDGHGSSSQEPELPQVTPWGVKERLSLEKTAVGFYLSGHLFDEVEREVRQFVRRGITELGESREPQLLAGIVSDLRVINGQRGKLALFRLDDKSGVIEARAEEALLNQHRNVLKDDELIIALGRVQPDRFSGGVQVTLTQIWDLPAARCRFGKFLRVAVNGKAPDVRRLLTEFPPKVESTEHGELLRGLPVRLVLERRAPAPIVALRRMAMMLRACTASR